jgi:hypothetical protein
MTTSPAGWDATRFAQPRFATIADLVGRLRDDRDWPSIERLDAVLRDELATVGVRLVEAAKTKATLLADGTIDPSSLYEVMIVERGEIPTRPRNAHDLLNAIVWAAFPQSKLALTQRLADVQRARAVGRTQLPSTRSREHDRLALVDEGAVLCVRGSRAPSTWIFGHAIYEHAYAGQLAVRGTPIDLDVPAVDDLEHVAARAAIDRCLAAADLAHVVRPGPGIPLTDAAR